MNTPHSTPTIKVAIICGGTSAEHEVSVQTARNVLEALDAERYTPLLVGINKQGDWYSQDPAVAFGDSPEAWHTEVHSSGAPVRLDLSTRTLVIGAPGAEASPDVVLPLIHGPIGEDGSMQGLLEIAQLPYVGAGVLASAIAMDKDITKRLLREAGLPVGDYDTLNMTDREAFDADRCIQKLGLPLFVKPANMGSSVGISKVEDAASLAAALDEAFKYDRKVLIEKMIVGDEIECGVLGNDHPATSVVGRIKPDGDFYTYDAKYNQEKNTVLEVPANLPADITKKAQSLAQRVYVAMRCEGLARIDMFVTEGGELVVNEINTLPGFTKLSMFPRLWATSGKTYPQLITNLIELAIARHRQKS